MKKILFFSLPIAAILPLASVVSCSSSKSDSELPPLDEKGNGFSSINPKDILGDSSNLTLAEIANKLVPKRSADQQIEIDKIKKSITSTKASGVNLDTVNENNYQDYFSIKVEDKNSILNEKLSKDFKIETYYDFYYHNNTISIPYALFQNNQAFYIGRVNIDGFLSPKQKEYSGTDKEKAQAKFKDELERLEKIANVMLNAPKWLNESILSKLYNLLDLEKIQINDIITFFTKENNKLNFVIGAKVVIMKSIVQVQKISMELLSYWFDRGAFDEKGNYNQSFKAPKLNPIDSNDDYKSYEVDWTSSSVDQKYRADFEAEVQKFNVAIKKSSATIYSMPIEFKPVVTKEVILKADKSWPIDKGVAFNKLTIADKLAWFKFADNANLANYYLDVIFDNQSNSFNFTIKYENKKVGKNTYYTIDGSTEIPSQKLTKPE